MPGAGPPVPLRGEPLSLDLVNTTFIDGGLRGRLVDALSTPTDLDGHLAGWAARLPEDLRAALAPGSAGERELALFRGLRDAIRHCLQATLTGDAADPIAVAEVNRCVLWSGTDVLDATVPLRGRRLRPTSDPWQGAAAEFAADAVRLLIGPDGAKLRACPAPGCILFFLRTHPRRLWCTDGCGNRVRVARHEGGGQAGLR
jgi:predicted RNA-binding Zn ribbon-like protein